MLSLIILTGLLLTATNTNAGGKSKNDETVAYSELGRNQGLYEGTIIEETTETVVTKISFAGDTTIDGIKKESDNSHNQLSLDQIAAIEVIDPLFESKRHQDREYSLVGIETLNGHREEMLMPRHLVICGQAVESNIKKSWALRTIQRIEIAHH